MAIILGYDVGTSATKVTACDEAGVCLGWEQAAYPLDQRVVGGAIWSEQDPEDWWRGACEATQRLLKAKELTSRTVRAIGLSGQMHGSVLLGADAAGSGGKANVLGPALLWNDSRATKECERLRELAGGEEGMVRLVGNAAREGFTLPKLLWLASNRPAMWKAARHLLLPKDYIAFRMTGAIATDVGDASGTLLFDVARRKWSLEACSLFGIDPELLPAAHESTATVGELTSSAREALGISRGKAPIPVIIGSGDNQTGAVGEGVVTSGAGLCIIGTSGVLLAALATPQFDDGSCLTRPLNDAQPVADAAVATGTGLSARSPANVGRLHTFCGAAGQDSWCMTGCTLSAGLALRWARDCLMPGASYNDVMSESWLAPAGCDGLLFFPYLMGERCPFAEARARGAWVGLNGSHRRCHLLRSVVEGVTFTLAQIADIARGAGVGLDQIRGCGGGNRSLLWRQLQADVFGVPLSYPAAGGAASAEVDRGGAYGAAILAAVGSGLFDSVRQGCSSWTLSEEDVTLPSPAVDERLVEAARRHARAAAEYRGCWLS